MFQHKMGKLFNDMPNVFGIGDDILVIGYYNNGTGHNQLCAKCYKGAKKLILN